MVRNIEFNKSRRESNAVRVFSIGGQQFWLEYNCRKLKSISCFPAAERTGTKIYSYEEAIRQTSIYIIPLMAIHFRWNPFALIIAIALLFSSRHLYMYVRHAIAEHGKFNIFIILAAGFSLCGLGWENMTISMIAPHAKCELQLTSADQGLLTSIGFIGIVLSAHFWGFLADTWGRRKVMQTSLLFGFIFSFLSSFASAKIWMLLARFLAGAL